MLNLTIDELNSIANRRSIDGYQSIPKKELKVLFTKSPVPLSRPKKPVPLLRPNYLLIYLLQM